MSIRRRAHRSWRHALAGLCLGLGLALAGCADVDSAEMAEGAAPEFVHASRVDQALTSEELFYASLEPALPACKDVCPDVALLTTTEGASKSDVLNLNASLTFCQPCIFSGRVQLGANVTLNCNGGIIDGRDQAWNAIETAKDDRKGPKGCGLPGPRIENVTIQNCTVQYSGSYGINTDRDFGQFPLAAGGSCCRFPKADGSCGSTGCPFDLAPDGSCCEFPSAGSCAKDVRCRFRSAPDGSCCQFPSADGTSCASCPYPLAADGTCTTDDPRVYFGMSTNGMHTAPYTLPGELVAELPADTQAWLARNPSLSDQQVDDLLRALGPTNIRIVDSTIRFNGRAGLYIRPYATNVTLQRSLFVRTPHKARLGAALTEFYCGEEPISKDNLDDRGASPACDNISTTYTRLGCEALKKACAMEHGATHRWSIYVDMESRGTRIEDVEFRQTVSADDGSRFHYDEGEGHIALDTSSDNTILASRFFGNLNGVVSFKNCGEGGRYRFQDPSRQKILGNLFALSPEATAVWLSRRQGLDWGNFSDAASTGGPKHCFVDAPLYTDAQAGDRRTYPWATMRPSSQRYQAIPCDLTYAGYAAVWGSGAFCRVKAPSSMSALPTCDAATNKVALYFDFASNSTVAGNWFARAPEAMPSVISWDHARQNGETLSDGSAAQANVIEGNYADLLSPQNASPMMATACTVNAFLLRVSRERSAPTSTAVTQIANPSAPSASLVASLNAALSGLR